MKAIQAYGEPVVDGTPSFCARPGQVEPHVFHAALHLTDFHHGPSTIALLVAVCDEGDEVGIEVSGEELRLIRDRIDRILTDAAEPAIEGGHRGPWVLNDTSNDEQTIWGPFPTIDDAKKWQHSLIEEYRQSGDEDWTEVEPLFTVTVEGK